MTQGGGTEPKRDTSDDLHDAADQVIGAAIGRVPKGSGLEQRLKEAGVVGLVLGVLMGNIPVAAFFKALLSGKATLNADALTVYWEVFKLVTPWVAVAAFFAFWILSPDNRPQIPMQGYAFLIAGLVFAAGTLSVWLGSPTPLVVLDPEVAGPTQAGVYVADSLNAYTELYGPWPVIAGALQGTLFGWWASILAED